MELWEVFSDFGTTGLILFFIMIAGRYVIPKIIEIIKSREENQRKLTRELTHQIEISRKDAQEMFKLIFDCKKEVLHSINEKIDNLGNKIVSGFIEIKEEINEQKIDNLPENFKKKENEK